MTVNIAFLCTDGVVVAADSMITPGTNEHPNGTGKHISRKLHLIGDDKLYTWAGDQGQADRLRMHLKLHRGPTGQHAHALQYPLGISEEVLTAFQKTMTQGCVDCEAFLAFRDSEGCHCCAFTAHFQPTLLDKDSYYRSLGSGKQLADPFLKYITDILCPRQPTVSEATFLAYWTILHVIEAGPGGVDHPIRIGTLKAGRGRFAAKELDDTEIDDQKQAVADLKSRLSDWRSKVNGSDDREASLPPLGPSKRSRPADSGA